jgi:hypothetical protein
MSKTPHRGRLNPYQAGGIIKQISKRSSQSESNVGGQRKRIKT